LRARVEGAVNPKDIIEEMWTQDVADLMWEVLRLRRLKAAFLEAQAHNGVQKVLSSLSDMPAPFLPKRWARRDPMAIKEVNKVLSDAGLTIDAVMAETLVQNLDSVERIDRMLSSAEGRRNNVLRELDRHRSTLAATLRRVTGEIEEAQFEMVPKGDANGSER
jgi:hypothetical protein